jgi:hypothetical protein
MVHDEEFQNPLLDEVLRLDEYSPRSTSKRWWYWATCWGRLISIAVCLAVGVAVRCVASSFLGNHHPNHGHVFYQATLKPNNQIEYAREFTAPCDYGILVFNVGPAAQYLPYEYDIYQDAYVFSNNKKMCWAYPTYRGIQKGPFPWWAQGDPTNIEVLTGLNPTRISHRVVRPAGAKNFTARKGGDYLVMAHHKFYTPLFYEHLKRTVNSWEDDDGDNDSDEMRFADFLVHLSAADGDQGGKLPVSDEFEVEAQF